MAKLLWVNQTTVTLERILRAQDKTSILPLPPGQIEIDAPPGTTSIGVAGPIPQDGSVHSLVAMPAGYYGMLFVFPDVPTSEEEMLKLIANL